MKNLFQESLMLASVQNNMSGRYTGQLVVFQLCNWKQDPLTDGAQHRQSFVIRVHFVPVLYEGSWWNLCVSLHTHTASWIFIHIRLFKNHLHIHLETTRSLDSSNRNSDYWEYEILQAAWCKSRAYTNNNNYFSIVVNVKYILIKLTAMAYLILHSAQL